MPLSPSRRKSAWTKRIIGVHADQGINHVSAFVSGNLAVHRGVGPDENVWVVTALASSLIIVRVPDQEQAKRAANVLSDECGSAFNAVNQDAIIKKLPPWVKPWIAECRKVGEFVDHRAFRDGVR